MTPSTNCRRLVAHFEGLQLKPYLCPAGVPTIGYGHTDGVSMATAPISQAQAESLLDQDLERFASGVAASLNRLPPQHQFDAIIAFAFNVGLGALRGSTLLRRWNSGDEARAADEFVKWCKAGGKTLSGLLRRRRAEQYLFTHGSLPADLDAA